MKLLGRRLIEFLPDEYDAMTPAELTAAREALRLSQVELAMQLGVHPTMVNRWERGRAKTAPYLRLALERLADTLDQHSRLK